MGMTRGFSDAGGYDRKLTKAARASVREVLGLKKGERILIVGNPDTDSRQISMSIFDASMDVGATPVLMFQRSKSSFDFTEEEVVKSFSTAPDVVLSISRERLGLDRYGLKHGYRGKRRYDNILDMLYEEKRSRAFWSPGITRDMFSRTVPIDYRRMREDCRRLSSLLDSHDSARVTAPSGTDIEVSIRGRKAMRDDGDLRRPGASGNMPAGEAFISPALSGVNGTIVFDGSMALAEGEIFVEDPIEVTVRDGFVKMISGGSEADQLRKSLAAGARNARAMVKRGELKSSEGEKYARNSRSIGELGIGLNRKAKIVANMLEDEKVYGTCHFAIGSNYDGDADSLIHLDGLVRSPTITLSKDSGSEREIMAKGRFAWD
jgi:aminopeptidase